MARHYQDTETRRRQVAEAALYTIAEDGVAGFTTRAIAERVGISEGALFRHFGNKEEIVLEALDLLEAELETGFAVTGNSVRDLESFFRHRAAFVGASASVGRLIFSDRLVHLAGESGRRRIDLWRLKNIAYLLELFEPLQKSGRIRTDLDLPALGLLIQGSLLTFAMQASLGRGGSPSELQARIDHAWGTLRTLLFA